MPLARLIFRVVFFAGVFGAHTALAQCYDQRAAQNAGICQVETYLQTDRDLSDTYQRMQNSMSPAQQTALQKSQQAWLASRDKQCTIVSNGHRYTDYGCMMGMETARLAALKAEMSAPVVDAGDHGIYAVYGTSMPWLWQAGGQNSSFQFGVQDGTGPIVITMKALHARAGDTITVKYIAGQYSIAPGYPMSDANGTPTNWDNSDRGSQALLPGAYMSPPPPHLGSLVGTFADSSGNITGSPFTLGDGPTDITVPQGASQLQLGMDDDVFSDNSGSIAVLVTLKTKS